MAESTPKTRIAEILEQRGWSQAELCRRSGVNHMTVKWAVRGEPVSAKNWLRLAKALGVPLREIAPDLDAAFREVSA